MQVTGNEKHPSFSVINVSAKKPDLLFPGRSEFIQKNFLPLGEHCDQQDPSWKPFKIV